MPVPDLLHGLFVLLTNGSYILPLSEAWARRSWFYGILFGSLLVLSFALHCEETGLCAALSPHTHTRVQAVDWALSYYLLNVMLFVVLEIREEVYARCAAAAWVLFILWRGIGEMPFNVLGSALLACVCMGVDVLTHNRRFTPAWWKRLALIALMAAVGALLFRLLKFLWVWHGLWHLYYAGTCYLLLLAQRTKADIRSRRAGKAGKHGKAMDAGATMQRFEQQDGEDADTV